MRWSAVILGGALWMCIATGSGAGEYQLVPAKLFRARDGLGNALAKLEAGKEVTVAYFGGSITAANGWRPMTFEWFQKTWPKAKLKQVHAAIGGTGSDLGVFRFEQDVLAHDPDLLFVEFAVNDGGAKPERIYRQFDGIIRKAWTHNPKMDICFVYTLSLSFVKNLQQGLCPRAASADERVADYFGIPSINVALRIVEMEREGKLVFHGERGEKAPEGKFIFTHDSCHPTKAGHEVFRDVIAQAIQAMEPRSKAGPHVLKKPFVADTWANAKMVAVEPSMLSGGWTKLPTDKGLGRAFHSRMPVIWEASKPGQKITFRFKGTLVKLYDLLGPDGCKAICSVDGKVVRTVKRFDHYCTYHRLATLSIAEGLEDKVHTVTVEVSPEQPDREPVLKRVRDKPNFDPKRYDGTGLRVGAIMLLGDIVK